LRHDKFVQVRKQKLARPGGRGGLFVAQAGLAMN